MKIIQLTKGEVTKVDDEDYGFLMQWKWCLAHTARKKKYATRSGGYKKKRLHMHRIIMNCPDGNGMVIDHIDGDGLNNQKHNMRICTQKENVRNQVKQENRSSKHKGVCWCKNRKKWHAKVKMNGKYYNVGRFDNEDDAGQAYNTKAAELFGAFAKLNIIG